jgi:hypothetical protein
MKKRYTNEDIEFIREHPEMTFRELAAKLGRTHNQMNVKLSEMKRAGLISRDANTRYYAGGAAKTTLTLEPSNSSTAVIASPAPARSHRSTIVRPVTAWRPAAWANPLKDIGNHNHFEDGADAMLRALRQEWLAFLAANEDEKLNVPQLAHVFMKFLMRQVMV